MEREKAQPCGSLNKIGKNREGLTGRRHDLKHQDESTTIRCSPRNKKKQIGYASENKHGTGLREERRTTPIGASWGGPDLRIRIIQEIEALTRSPPSEYTQCGWRGLRPKTPTSET